MEGLAPNSSAPAPMLGSLVTGELGLGHTSGYGTGPSGKEAFGY